ncbi:hypothetical protein [Streptomyces cinereoruber]|uniref:hypothetical protein n=1 Tax=Streptomyces cinereoruber TaxID=67260 RepID=UPI00362F7847
MSTEKNYTVLHEYVDDPTNRKIRALNAKVNRATPPDDIWTDEAQLLGQGSWHCDLAPDIAVERWGKVAELRDSCDRLEEHWYELESATEEVRKDAAKAHANALRKGTKPPSTAAKVLDADAQLEGCSMVLAETVTDLRRARKAYDALLDDRVFLNNYRSAVIAEFKAQRKRAAEAYNVAAGAIAETRRRYSALNSLTMGGLLDIPEDDKGYVVVGRIGWGQAGLSEALELISRQVREDDPFLSGEFLTLPMEKVNAMAVERAEKMRGGDRQNYLT